MAMESLILIGGGGHCKACIDVIEASGQYRIEGIVDLAKKIGQSVLGYKIIVADEDLPRILNDYQNFFITLGQIKSADRRRDIYENLAKHSVKIPVIVSPRAYVSPHASIGAGSIIMHASVVQPGVQIGLNCILNTGCIIEHDVQIGDHCHIATGALVNGDAVVAAETFIGSQAVIREGIKIGTGCLIGAGGRIMRDMADGARARDLI